MLNKLTAYAQMMEFKTRRLRYTISLVLALALIVILVVTRINLGKQLSSFENTSLDLLGNTKETLTVFESSIPDITGTLTGVANSLDDLKASSNALPGLLENVGTLIGSDFVSIAEEGKKSLDTAASSARIIDETLSFLSRIPLLNVQYDPAHPLELGLRQLAENFSSITPGLDQIETDLATATKNLGSLSGELESIHDSLTKFNKQFQDLKMITVDYRVSLEALESNLSSSITAAQRNLTILLVILILLILLWIVNISLNFFASFSTVSGRISDEQHRSEVPALGDDIVSNQSNQRSE